MSDSQLPKSDHKAWQERSGAELDFWRKWIHSGGMRWKEGFARKTDPKAPLLPRVEDLAARLGLEQGSTLEILDIGSGPLSYVGTQSPNYAVNLTAVDPLADQYNQSLDNKGIEGVGRPSKGYFETALWQLGAQRFDIVWCANSLDHSIDPVLGLYNIINVCKSGGGVILLFHPNEAEGENYQGLHQWNLNAWDGVLMLTRKERKFELMKLLKDQGDVRVQWLPRTELDKPRVVVTFRKDADCNLSECLIG
jgi:SAM-dependent methyltransferase